MQKSTGKELAVMTTNEIRELLEETLAHDHLTEKARVSVTDWQQLALFHAWQTGIRLNKLKTIIGHGNWVEWSNDNYCKPLKRSRATAELYMRIDNDNPNMRHLRKPKTEHVLNLKFDTIRKYKLGFAPGKDQPNHKGNAKLPRSVTFLNIVNEYNRVMQRHIDGLEEADLDEIREETSGPAGLYALLRFVHGDSAVNPWAAR
jgi:hypothetical protein